jgi:hypothetical protein
MDGNLVHGVGQGDEKSLSSVHCVHFVHASTWPGHRHTHSARNFPLVPVAGSVAGTGNCAIL